MVRLFFVLFSLSCVSLFSQEQWASYFEVLQAYDTRDEIKLNVSNKLTERLVSELERSVGFDVPEGLPMHKVASPDGQLMIYTWHYTFQDASSNYGGVLVHHDVVIPLTFAMTSLVPEEEYNASQWGGGIYYDLIPISSAGDTIYTLLAWDGNNGVSFKKVIEILSFDRKGLPVFGASVFKDGGRRKKRVVLEYSAEMSLLLKYDEDAQCIVTNALHSNDQRFSGVQEYYSATDAFNVFRYENHLWTLYNNVDLRLNKKESKRLDDSGPDATSGL